MVSIGQVASVRGEDNRNYSDIFFGATRKTEEKNFEKLLTTTTTDDDDNDGGRQVMEIAHMHMAFGQVSWKEWNMSEISLLILISIWSGLLLNLEFNWY